MTHSNVRHSLPTTFISGDIRKLKTNIKLLENSGLLHQVRLHNKNIEESLKDDS